MLNRGQTYAVTRLIRVIESHLAIVEILLLLCTHYVRLLLQGAHMSLMMRRYISVSVVSIIHSLYD